MSGGWVRTYKLAPVRTAAPAADPVSLEEARLHCRVDHEDDNALIEGLIAAATAHFDGYTGILGRALVTQTWRQDFGGFCTKLRLPLAPVSGIAGITYFDCNNAEQTLTDDVCGLFVDALGPFVALKSGQSWPSTSPRQDAVSVSFIAGTAAAEVPAPIKQAILLMIGHWYANREAVAPGDIRDLPMAVGALTAPYRRIGV